MKKNIALVGYMGAGKSTIGKELASRLNMQFVDLDEQISMQEKRNISDIFAQYGEYYFRKKERFYLKELLEQPNILLALGGGTPCFFDNINILNQSFTTIYLKVNLSILIKRLGKENHQRPIIHGIDNLKDFVVNHFQEREKFYQQANVIISIEDHSVDWTCTEILSRLAEFSISNYKIE